MEWMKEIRRRVGMLLNRQQFDADLEEEMRLHLELRAKEKRLDGLTPEEAHYSAQRRFGNPTHLKEVSREAWGWSWLEHFAKDAAFGMRLLRLNPGFATAAILSLALGIGANTAIFQLLNAVRMRVLPVRSPQEIAEIRIENFDNATGSFNGWNPQNTYPQFEHIRKVQQSFSGVFAWADNAFNLATGGEVRYARGLLVSGEYFSVLGVQPHAGRLLSEADDQRGCGAPAVVISYPFWQSEYGGLPTAIGEKITLDNHVLEITGVTPPGFYGMEVGRQFDIAVPMCFEDTLRGERSRLNRRDGWWLTVMGRRKPGMNLTQATAQLKSISPALYESTVHPGYNEKDRKTYLDFKLAAFDASTGVSQLRSRFEQSLVLLLAIAGLVLTIACANLANLLLARAGAREREIAVRLALGASRGRLVRQLMAESFLLAATGASLGLLLAQNLSRILVTFVGTERNRWDLDLRMDWQVLGFTAALAILTCVLFGLTPALRATRSGPGESLKSGGRGTTAGRQRHGLRRALVVTQVALSLVLVIGALLFSRSFQKLINENAGFRQDGLLVAEVDFTSLRIPRDARRVALSEDLLARVRRIPGVEGAALTFIIPLRGSGWNNFAWMEGKPKEQKSLVWMNRVSDGYFKTLGIPILMGRDFDARDTLTAPLAAIVTEAFARRFLNGGNPVGLRFRTESDEPGRDRVFEIVGLVRDSKYNSIRREIEPIVFLSTLQDAEPYPGADFMIRSSIPPAGISAEMIRMLREVNPQISVDFSVFQTVVRTRLLQDRLMATLSAFFGVLAALLAAIGLYGVISYMAERRKNEIGIRMALGANPGNVISMILREAGALVAVGAALGTLLALAAGRAAQSMLFGMQPYDAVSMALAVAGMAVVSLLASYVPAYRAARMDPLAALREE